MMKTVEAIYEQGVLKLASMLPLQDGAHVRVTVEADGDRVEWLKASQETLLKTWDNDRDDVFNELLDR